MESKDLDTMDLATLFGKLQEHEMELGRLSMHEKSDGNELDYKKKSIALKTTSTMDKALEVDSQSEDSDSSIDEETMRNLCKKLRKHLRRKGRVNRSENNDSKSSHKNKSKDEIVCHECKKPGHIKYVCPKYLKRMEKEKKNPKHKRAYIVWDEPEKESISSSSDEEVATLCLNAQVDEGESSNDESSEQSEDSNVSETKSEISSKYELLYFAYEEMHEQLKKLAKKNLERKKAILKYQQDIIDLQKQVDELNLQNETLDLIYASATCDCANNLNVVVDCGNCKLLEKENEILKNKLASFTKGNNSLCTLLNSQRVNSNKFGLGFTNARRKSNRNVVDFSMIDFSNAPTCFYCGSHGHTSNVCYVKMHGIPKGDFVWVKKGENPLVNKNGPKTIWVPKSKT